MDFLNDNAIPPRHLSRRGLYTDFQTRVNYLHRFLDFNNSDIAALTEGGKYLKAIAPTIAHRLYDKLLQTDLTAQAFRTRSTCEEPDVTEEDEFYKMDHRRMLRQKIFLRWYLTRLCGDPSKIDFWIYMDKIAMMHSGLGQVHDLDIEFVHIGAALGFLQDFLLENLLSPKPDNPVPQQLRLPLMRSLTKVLWIQNDFFARWRVRETQEFLDQMEPVRPEAQIPSSTASTTPTTTPRPKSSSTQPEPPQSAGCSSVSSSMVAADGSVDRVSVKSSSHKSSKSTLSSSSGVPVTPISSEENQDLDLATSPGSGCPFSGIAFPPSPADPSIVAPFSGNATSFEAKVWSESSNNAKNKSILQRRLSKGKW